VEPGSSSPLFDLFRKGEVPRDVRILAARGIVAPTVHEQLALLVLLATDRDGEVAGTARATLEALPAAAVAQFLSTHDVSDEVRAYFRSRGVAGEPAVRAPDASPPGVDVPLGDLERELESLLAPMPVEGAVMPDTEEPAGDSRRVNVAMLPVLDRMKLALRGTREQRAVLVRDANRLVSASVLSSPKLTDSEVESFARMANVSEDVLRTIGTTRTWTKNYSVVAALSRNPKTPPAVSMSLVSRLNERDLKGLSIDRNVPEGLRISARKLLATSSSRRQ
jgi:hypothetical protein